MDLNARLLALLAQQGAPPGAGGGDNGAAQRDAQRRNVEELMRNSPNELFRFVHKWKLEPERFEKSARVDTVRHLLEDEAIRRDIDLADDHGQTALHYALQSRQHKVARLLVEAGADVFGVADDQSPLRLIFCGTKGPVGATTLVFAKWLLARLEGLGQGPEAAACLNRRPSSLLIVSRKKHEQLPTCELLLKHGVDPMSRDMFGWTALHHAAKRGHVGLAKLLIARGADVNAVKNDGYTPLHLAALNNKSEVAMLLLAAGAMTEPLTGENEERPVLSRKNAADLADINNHQCTAYLIRTWTSWNAPPDSDTTMADNVA